MTVCRTLREANITRQREWDTGGKIDLSYAGNELAGEVSEAIDEACLMIEQNDRAGISDLADEIADVVICIDLIAIRAGLDPIAFTTLTDASSEDPQQWVNETASGLKGVCNVIKKLERERFGMPGSRATLAELEQGLFFLQLDVFVLALCFEIDVLSAVARKFNATSVKVGLHTRLDHKSFAPTCTGV